jgi:hypothetical protein
VTTFRLSIRPSAVVAAAKVGGGVVGFRASEAAADCSAASMFSYGTTVG